MKFIPKGPIHKKSTLIQVVAWHRIGYKPPTEPILTKFYDAIWHISGANELIVDGLVQDCSNSSALAMELLQSCT